MERLIRRSPEEKLEIIHLVEHSNLSIKQTLEELDVPRSTFSQKTLGQCIAGTGSTRKTGRMG
jgi:transposase-like protein